MIDIQVYGPDYGKVKPESVAEGLFRVAWSALDVLGLHDKVKAKVDILVGTKRMEGKFLDTNIGGYCSAFEDTKSKEYEVDIELARLSDVETMYLNLCHEIIHMKQFVLKELGTNFQFLEDEITITSAWKGKPWVAAKNQDGYFDSPWEKEAYEKEHWLYERAIQNLTHNINRRKR